MIELDRIYNEDCLEGMKRIPDGMVDAIITDLPYGTTRNPWDSVIPLDQLWEQFKRVTKKNAAIVLFSQQPFTSQLIMSNPYMFKHEWIWEKDSGTGFLNANYAPLKQHENICVFSKSAACYVKDADNAMTFNPQKSKGSPYKCKQGSIGKNYDYENSKETVTVNNGERNPTDVVYFISEPHPFHPTQKPVDLLRYLILTYSNSGGGNFGRHHRQRHHRHRLHQGKEALHRFRAEQRILRQSMQAYQGRTTAVDAVLI